jgi:SHS2 domain-containing protein
MASETVPPGVAFLDHTADVGLDVVAPTLAELFIRAAAGMACLIHGADGGAAAASADVPPAGAPPQERSLTLSADDLPALLRAWLRELLHWHEAEGLAVRGVRFDTLTPTGLEATVTLAPDTEEPMREIKGVTLHGLAVEHRDGGWAGRVIFDV